MNRKIPLALMGLLICLLVVGMVIDNVDAQTLSTAVAGDAVAAAQTSPNLAASLGVTAVVPVAGVAVPSMVVATPWVTVVRPAYMYVPRRVVYVAPVPHVRVVPVKVTHYRRLYATPVRNATRGRYRTAVELVSYPLIR